MNKERTNQLSKAVDFDNYNSFNITKDTKLDYFPTTADTMMRHLRYKTIRK